MEYDNYLMKEPNEQGYRILTGQNINTYSREVDFEWALIDRGEGRTPCVAHCVTVGRYGKWCWEMEDIEWSWGHYFETLEEAEVYYREQVIKTCREKIAEMQEYIEFERSELKEVRKLIPEEEDY